MPGATRSGWPRGALAGLTRVSRMLDDVLNRVPDAAAPYVGASAFAHKAGLHASAILKDPTTYEHVPPEVVGNERIIPMSNQAGLSNLRKRLATAGIAVTEGDPRLAAILAEVKAREDRGYAYDGAAASFELLARRDAGRAAAVLRGGALPGDGGAAARTRGARRSPSRRRWWWRASASERVMSVSESQDPVTPCGPGAGERAERGRWRKDLGPYQDYIADMRLVDFRVRITSGGTEAVTRVLIDSEDGQGRRWSTVGVSANIVDASFQALQDAIVWKLLATGRRRRDDAGVLPAAFRAGARGAGPASPTRCARWR